MPHWLSEGAPNASLLVLKWNFDLGAFFDGFRVFCCCVDFRGWKSAETISRLVPNRNWWFRHVEPEAVFKKRKSHYASRLVLFAVSCFFRVALLLRLECSNASPLEPNRRPASARASQSPADPGEVGYVNSLRLDLLYIYIYIYIWGEE